MIERQRDGRADDGGHQAADVEGGYAGEGEKPAAAEPAPAVALHALSTVPMPVSRASMPSIAKIVRIERGLRVLL